MDDESTMGRRTFLGAAAVATGAIAAGGMACASTGSSPTGSQAPTPPRETGVPNTVENLGDNNIYTRLLGVRPHLGAHEHISRLGGGRIIPEAMAAMVEANDYFVDLEELNLAAGRRIAELMDAEAAHVSSGGFSAMVLGAAACLTGNDRERIAALPHVTWPRCECLIQTAQKFSYDRAYRVAGATNVYAKTRPELLAALGDRTAMLAGLSNVERQGNFGPAMTASRAVPPDPDYIHPEELVAIGKRAGVPVIIDMASDMPPWDNLQRFLRAGVDLIALSGGKTIGGPQSTGILLGRRDLVEAARLNASPNDNIGRGMKVGKEEIIGLVVAVEHFVKQDHVAETERWAAMARRVAEHLSGIPGLTATAALNTSRYTDVDLRWDEAIVSLDRAKLQQQLADGSPRVAIEIGGRGRQADGESRVSHALARTRLLRNGEEMVLARRLRQIFESAGGSAGT